MYGFPNRDFGPGVLAWQTKRSWPLFSPTFGPGVLACATRGGGRSEAGRCFHLLFAPEKKVIFARFFATASVRSRSLDHPLVPGVFEFDVITLKN